ncbi:Fe-S oxidoreductase [Methanomicrobiaceae archaeon CYW5]|uniref:YkgJ family cysteine cluster protein n=1 Tax=Methanovulcanius yangii TaxID=1789227 RepID=UPI0029C9C070|nr:YkgJ family cysteine cluster protein [Methanovulcanius yangii]MBT8507937.1 Fe-S oxidoreductase [Methanovulcanius yangii]
MSRNQYLYRQRDHYAEELDALRAYPVEEFVGAVAEIGFGCDCCSRCCTRAFNDHVFLLEEDAVRAQEIDPASLVPAPYYEACDQNGTFYVSGYALRTREDGRCIFLDDEGRCRIYDRRFSICRVYPYMLHRETGEDGAYDWRLISGLNEHGTYHNPIPDEECRRIAAETVAYETAYLEQEIRFFDALAVYFEENGLRHIRRTFDMNMREFEKGTEVRVRVYHQGQFFDHCVSKYDY